MLLTPRGPASAVPKANLGAASNPPTAASPGRAPGFAIRGVSPNPVATDALVRFALPEGGRATLELIDVAGRRVWARDLGDLDAGEHEARLTFDRRPPRGVCFVRLHHGAHVATARIAVVR